jgi:ubiquinone/menaquinone biosynthesis C-methylase UbiE
MIEDLLPLNWCEHYVLKDKGIYPLMSGKVLDVGCGMGFFSDKISKYVSWVTGIDIKKSCIDLAIPEKNVNFAQADAERIPFKDKTFDCVFCSEVIEHLINKEKGISEMIRVLKDNGMFIMVITVKSSITGWLFERVFRWFDKDYPPGSPEIHNGEMFTNPKKMDTYMEWRGFEKVKSVKFRTFMIIFIDMLMMLVERKKRKDYSIDYSTWLEKRSVKLYIIFILPLVKALAWIDGHLPMIDYCGLINVYKAEK